MPKNSRSGGRAPKNFDPRYSERAKKSGNKTIGRTHRGFRDTEAGGDSTKRRWTSEQRAGRDQARAISDGRSGGFSADRAGRDDRRSGGFRSDRDDRRSGGFRSDRDDRRSGGFANDRDDRRSGGFRSDRDDRRSGGFSGQRDDRRSGGFRSDRDDRRSGGFANDRDDRRSGGFANDRDDRRSGGFANDRDDRRSGGFRSDRDDRRSGGFRSDRDDRRSGGFRSDRNDRRSGGFSGQRDDRGARRSFDRDDRPRANRSDWNADKKAAFEPTEDVVHERLQAAAISADDVTATSFDDLGLGQNIVRVLAELGAEKPFPIQAATIPVILEGRDTLGRGRTGSGKTIAFGAPLVEAILRSKAGVKREFGRAPSALILAPTRELALQIDRTVQPIARSVGLFTTQIYGGVPQARQVGALKKGVDIIIGTPGRIEDLHQQGKLDLSQVKIAVLDEADHMCELGFLEPVQRILRLTADDSQKLLFSATLDREVEQLVKEFLVKPAVYEVAGEDQDSGTIDHRVLVIDHREKSDILADLVTREGKTLVFTRTRSYAETLVEEFDDAGIAAVALHGDLNQAKRTRNLQKLSAGKVNVLVATDVAARGIHVDDIDLVVQADAPMEYKTYLHRSGRTGRAGRAGTVVTLVSRGRQRRVGELLERAEIQAPFLQVRAGDEVIDEITGRSMTVAELSA